MQLHEIQQNNRKRNTKRVGRGGKRGKTSGHGHKGQKQHGGHGIRPEMRDVIKRLPKLRGHGINRSRTVNSSKVAYTPVNLSDLDKVFENDSAVNPRILVEKKVVSRRAGKEPKIKILGGGDLKKKLTIEKCAVSASAKVAIEKAGGLIQLNVESK